MASDRNAPAAPGFVVIHGNRLEDLRALLLDYLAAHPSGVLEPEIMLVQSNGMKQWLEQGMAAHPSIGICAATRIELPAAYLWQVYRRVLGAEQVPMRMAFDKMQLVWRLYRLLPELTRRDPAYEALRRYLGEPLDARKRYQLAFALADVFDGYQSYRADWLADWQRGRDRVRAHVALSSEDTRKLDDLNRWQAQLWRDLLADVGPAHASASRASVHQAFLAALDPDMHALKQTDSVRLGLPGRIIVFGISSLSTQTLEALAALGQYGQVMMFVLNPCRYFWGDIEQARVWQQRSATRGQASDVLSGAASASSAQELLASWGKQGRDYLHLLSDFDQTGLRNHQLARVDVFFDPVESTGRPKQLAQLQSGILNLEPASAEPLPLAPDDDSICLISTYSAQRELEVLHDQLLTWLNADPDLQPRDVMVMVPDMADFSAQVRAAFGRFKPGDARFIPYTMADPGESGSPILQALRQLLGLPTSRLSLLEWNALLEVDAVRNRFGLSQADVERLSAWLTQAGVRWGLDSAHRVRSGLSEDTPGLDQNSWAFGLRRLLLGYAFDKDCEQAWQGVLPEPAVGSLDAPLVAKLLDWLEAIEHSIAVLSVPHSPDRWVSVLFALAERFLAPVDAAQERQLLVMLEALEDWQQACTDANLHEAVPLEVVAEHWLAQLEPSGLRQPFLGAGVQFATLMPMRAIPFKVVCLLGMTDGAYPRATSARDFDLMALSWRAGDRSRREDDRYLFLEAILSARQKLLISWQGHRPHDNAHQPPSVLVAQLIDHLNRGWTPARSVVEHPLQPFSKAYFRPGSPLQTFDGDWGSLHAPAAQSAALPGFVLETQAESSAPDALSLQDLRRLLRQPVEVFFRQQLGVTFDALESPEDEDELFALDALARHRAGQSLVQARDTEQALQALALAGQWPLAAFGDAAAVALRDDADALQARKSALGLDGLKQVEPLMIDLMIDGCRLTGSVDQLWARPTAADGSADRLQLQSELDTLFVDKGARRRSRHHRFVGLWVHHVALCASGHALRSVVLGLDAALVFEALTAQDAHAILQRWVGVYAEALRRPLPVACMSAWAYLHSIAPARDASDSQAAGNSASPLAGVDEHELARTVFEGTFEKAPERKRSDYLARAFSDYEEIAPELPHWAQVIYGDMYRHAKPLEAASAYV